MTDGKSGAVLLIGSAGLILHPWAAIGAAFGCCFFLAMPSATRGMGRLGLGVFSWGIGYAAGVFAYGDGPPWDSKAMLVAACVAALAAVCFTGIFHAVAKGGPLPPWLESTLDRVPFLKSRRGADDGS